MYKDSKIIVLTENNWLYAGLQALFPNIYCDRLNVCGYSMFENDENVRLILVVDCLIFLSKKCMSLNTVLEYYSKATVVWLKRRETGLVFPQGRQGDKVISLDLNVNEIRNTLRKLLFRTEKLPPGKCIKELTLTNKEKRLLPLFISEMNMHTLSKLTGHSVKTLYTHRRNILNKTGFRTIGFLRLVYDKLQF
ncbi:TPA: helix-turn-helix transcriptional regulator [Salmonella enterica]